ncbi:tRNA A-37 threonylcarbamoyl transferase component Bud32 [Actinomadura namibiensis]|uniref:non-specific serine/threonine protein kinase n=1 Tax=Actinomadura namibiensis TaxID=182080 RepID=A0A7W3LRX2_ACTNM|nr:serine/threonine-protein kinase [Actinomadura namibiensis]MBA8953153.1 tRNA A-37 threonylcarbamoyl transferase component Bud32 [Actinomadura namibiensis]
MLAGRYRNLGRIGQGGMGSVWRAHDIDLDREVAIKELRVPEQVTDQERRVWYARMEREARAAARLRHTGIVTVHDRVMGDDGRPWIVMELVRGRSLEQLLAERKALPPGQVAAIGLAMLDALLAAHAQGVVHRDVKPANVLLEGDRVLLTDFGIAALEGDVTITRSGMVLGTPAYMSPEQVEGKAVTPASDLWSLAATLYVAVEGHRPFDGPSHGAVFVAIATQQPPAPRCGGPLAQVLNGLLRKDPNERLSPTQVRDLLNTVLNPAPATTADVGPPIRHRLPRTTVLQPPTSDVPLRRHRTRLVRAALLCAALAALTFMLGPWRGTSGKNPIELYADETIMLLLPVGVAFIVMCGLWFLPHRPALVLALVFAILGCLHLEALVVYGRGWARDVPVVEPHVGFEISWVLSTIAFMIAFTAVNPSLAGQVTNPSARSALLTAVVLVEGLVALLWVVPIYEMAGSGLDLDSDHNAPLIAPLMLLGLIWLGAQPFIWSSKIRTEFSRR